MKKSELNILVVDDEMIVRESLTKWFQEDGFHAEAVADGATALKKLQSGNWNLLITDIRMPGMDGMELLHRARKLNRNIVVIVVTAFATVDTAVRALKEGAYDYITKPIDPDYLSHIVVNALEQQLLTLENQRLRDTVSELTAGVEIIGECPEMRRVLELVQTVAQTDTVVLVRGEVGTGKELVARAIHQASARRFAPMVTVNCGAVADAMLADELFGHEKDAFTGAHQSRKGKIEQADGGTLFLDEVANLDTRLQGDLLHVIETEQMLRLGGTEPVRTGFRLLCASSVDLGEAVRAGRFREDLYYRMTVFEIALPPLRARRGDIAKLAHFFLVKYARSMNRKMSGFSPDAMLALKAYEWPGNVRELQNVIERALVMAPGSMINREHLVLHTELESPSAGKKMDDVERRHIELILRETGWNVSRSAAILDIDRVTLYHKIEKYHLKREG
ncbi:MAG: Response regulator [Bacteroidetes bacterium]|nr:Response regulator [Bacteroidota bacterium]